MAEKKKTAKRPVALPRLHKSVVAFCDEYGLDRGQTINDLLERVRDAWFDEAQKK